MTLKEALDILNLKEDCTEEELKLSHRKLIKINHPDTTQDEKLKEELHIKSQKINKARDIVKKHIKPNDNINIDNAKSDLNTLKNRYEIEMLKEIKYIIEISKKEHNITAYSYHEKFMIIINEIKQKLKYINNIEELTEEYRNYRKKYINLLYAYNNYWSLKLSINENELANHIGISLQKEITLEFYRNKILEIINYNLNKELEKYKNIEDNDILKDILIKVKYEYGQCCIQGIISLNQAKVDFSYYINEFITKYYKRKELLKELIQFGIDKSIIDKLQKNILNEKLFYYTYDNLKKTSIKYKIGRNVSRLKNKLKIL